MAAPNPVEFHRYHRSHRGNDRRNSADEIANHDDASFGPMSAPSIEYFGVEHVEAAPHNVAAAHHFLLALQLAAGFVGHEQAFGL